MINRFFEPYNELLREISYSQEKIAMMEFKLHSISAVTFSDMPKSHNNIDIAYRIGDKEDEEAKLKELQEKLYTLKKKYIKVIEMLSNGEDRIIIQSIYLEKLSYNVIADIIGYSVQTFYNRKHRAEHRLEVLLNKEEIRREWNLF